MIFDPARKRQSLDEILIPMARSAEFAEAFQLKCLDSYGGSILGTCIECCLVGQFSAGKELLPKARTFLRTAIEHKEIPPGYGRGGTESRRLNAFALCQWLITGRKDLENLKEAVRWREVWFNDQAKSEKTEVQLTLADYLNAEEYDTVLARYAAAGLTPPKALRNIKGEGTVCYVLARHRLGLEYSTEEVGTAVETFLKRSMAREWLDRGQFDTVAVWMMLTQWKPGDDPIATLLKCYKYLPNLTAPA